EPGLIRPLPHPAVDLRCQHHFLSPSAALRDPATENLLGHALADLPAIDIRGIEKVDLVLQRPIHDPEAVRLRCLRPEIHAAETQATHAKSGSTEMDVLHNHVPAGFSHSTKIGNQVQAGHCRYRSPRGRCEP